MVRIGQVYPALCMTLTVSQFCNLNLRFEANIKTWSLPQLPTLILGTTGSANSFCRMLGRTGRSLLQTRSIGWEGALEEQSTFWKNSFPELWQSY
jgi:hypothetical protein